MSTLRSFLLDENGTETVEWGLMVGMIVGGLVLVVTALGVWMQSRFESLQAELGA